MKASFKDCYRELFKSISRFLSIMLITAIGIMVYIGMNLSTYDINKYINDKLISLNTYDILIEAPFGFSQKDIEIINNLDGLENIEYYTEEIKDNVLYIYKDNADKSRLINFYENGYIETEYIQKSIMKNGVLIKDAYILNDTSEDRIYNKVKLYFKNDYLPLSSEYKEFVEQKQDYIINQLKNSPSLRHKEIILKYDDGITQIDNVINDLENKIDELETKNTSLNSNLKDLNNAKKIIYNNEQKINNALSLLNEKETELLNNKEKVISGLEKIKENEENISKAKKDIIENEKKLNSFVSKIFLSDDKISNYKKQIEDGKNQIQNYYDKKIELENALVKINDGIVKIQKEKANLINKKKLIEDEKYKYNRDYKNNYNKINDAINKINDSINKINININDLNTKKQQINTDKMNLAKPFYIVNTLYNNDSFSSLESSIRSVNILKYIYITLFFFISIFVVVSTMIRFVDEQNMNAGIYRFLGYDNKILLRKYYFYSFVPIIIGCIIGMFFGTYIIPKFIIKNLLMITIFNANDVKLYYNLNYILQSIILFIISIIIIVYIVYKKQTKKKVIDLLTGNNYEFGKRILLERLRIWKKLSFSHKIFIRNIFKYKTRLIMTVLGISSCSALIYLGLSLKFSINTIPRYQYQNITKYDAIVQFKPNVSDEKINEYINRISNKNEVLPINIDLAFMKNDKYNLTINVISTQNENISKFVKIKDTNVNITEKISNMFNLNVADNFSIYDKYRNKIDLVVGSINENYISDYIYIKQNKPINTVFVKYIDGKNDINDDIVYNINYSIDNIIEFNNTVESINKTMILIIVIAGILTIIVTYNIGNINILERRKEISTLKVLGYNDYEQKMYIFREIVLLSILSTLIGLYLGRKLQVMVALLFLNSKIQFILKLNYKPFVYTIIIVSVFITIVLLILSKKISKIEMSKALKITE